MVIVSKISSSHSFQETSESDIALTEVVLQIELILTRKQPGPYVRVECVGNSLDPLIFVVLSDWSQLQEVSTSDDLLSVSMMHLDLLVNLQMADCFP